jgi:hypothetical protein
MGEPRVEAVTQAAIITINTVIRPALSEYANFLPKRPKSDTQDDIIKFLYQMITEGEFEWDYAANRYKWEVSAEGRLIDIWRGLQYKQWVQLAMLLISLYQPMSNKSKTAF